MENANDMGYNLFSDNPDDWGQERLSQKKTAPNVPRFGLHGPTISAKVEWSLTRRFEANRQSIYYQRHQTKKSNTMDTKVYFSILIASDFPSA